MSKPPAGHFDKIAPAFYRPNPEWCCIRCVYHAEDQPHHPNCPNSIVAHLNEIDRIIAKAEQEEREVD